MKKAEREKRTKRMVNMYTVKGMTYEAIGGEYDLTRERVRQILSSEGITRWDGGVCLTTERKREAKQAKLLKEQQKRLAKNYGCTVEEYIKIGQGKSFYKSPIHKYRNKRRNTIEQGVKWDLSLPDWWKIWQQSGKWKKRGLGKKKYVMSRKDMNKPFTKDNAIVITLQDSSYSARMRKLATM